MSDRSERFTWREGDISITKRPDPPRDRGEDEDRPEQERQEDLGQEGQDDDD